MRASGWVIEEWTAEDVYPAHCASACSTRGDAVGTEAPWPGAVRLEVRSGERVLARLSWEVSGELYGAPGLTGIVGQYEATDGAAGVLLLRRAVERCAAAGARRVIGPMNGSTWARYRFALPADPGAPGDEARAFPGEPRNPPEYPAQFEVAGFTIASRYESRLVTDLAAPRPGAEALAARMARSGVTVRSLDVNDLETELERLWRFSEAAFAGSLYFRPLDFGRFRAAYLQLLPLLDPELVRLAHHRDGRLLGFVFAMPDPTAGPNGQGRRLVLKTLAAAPDRRVPGIGAHLADEIHRLAREKGYAAVIHALMHVSNDSVRISARYRSELLRRYALYHWTP